MPIPINHESTFRESTKAISETLQAGPPVAIASASAFMGVSFQNWVYILTAIYTLLQIFRLFPKILSCAICFIHHRKCDGSCTVDMKGNRRRAIVEQ